MVKERSKMIKHHNQIHQLLEMMAKITIVTTGKTTITTMILSETPSETPTIISNDSHYKTDIRSSSDSHYIVRMTTGKKTTSNLPRISIQKWIRRSTESIQLITVQL